jgi:hypothetical protein
MVTIAGAIISYCLFFRCAFLQSEQLKKPPKKVWTNDDFLEPSVNQPPEGTVDPNHASIGPHYVRSKDPNRYRKQLAELHKQLEATDAELKATAETIRTGRVGTSGFALDKPPEAATTGAGINILSKRRSELAEKIDELESEAVMNDITPGELRREIPESGSSTAPPTEAEAEPPDLKEAEWTLEEQEERLKRAKNELDLLSRRLDLDQRDVYSNPNYWACRLPASVIQIPDLSGLAATRWEMYFCGNLFDLRNSHLTLATGIAATMATYMPRGQQNPKFGDPSHGSYRTASLESRTRAEKSQASFARDVFGTRGRRLDWHCTCSTAKPRARRRKPVRIAEHPQRYS